MEYRAPLRWLTDDTGVAEKEFTIYSVRSERNVTGINVHCINSLIIRQIAFQILLSEKCQHLGTQHVVY